MVILLNIIHNLPFISFHPIHHPSYKFYYLPTYWRWNRHQVFAILSSIQPVLPFAMAKYIHSSGPMDMLPLDTFFHCRPFTHLSVKNKGVLHQWSLRHNFNYKDTVSLCQVCLSIELALYIEAYWEKSRSCRANSSRLNICSSNVLTVWTVSFGENIINVNFIVLNV